jgi:hypothetical protein
MLMPFGTFYFFTKVGKEKGTFYFFTKVECPLFRTPFSGPDGMGWQKN